MISKNEIRLKRHQRIRNKISGTPEIPRLNVFRSNKQIYAQLVDDIQGVTIVSASSNDKELKAGCAEISKAEAAEKVGEAIAKRANEKGVKKCVFDRGGYVYNGRVKALAEAARKAGLEF